MNKESYTKLQWTKVIDNYKSQIFKQLSKVKVMTLKGHLSYLFNKSIEQFRAAGRCKNFHL